MLGLLLLRCFKPVNVHSLYNCFDLGCVARNAGTIESSCKNLQN